MAHGVLPLDSGTTAAANRGKDAFSGALLEVIQKSFCNIASIIYQQHCSISDGDSVTECYLW